MPGCARRRATEDDYIVLPTAARQTSPNFDLPIPPRPVPVAMHVCLQAWLPAAGYNPGLIISNAGGWVVGNVQATRSDHKTDVLKTQRCRLSTNMVFLLAR